MRASVGKNDMYGTCLALRELWQAHVWAWCGSQTLVETLLCEYSVQSYFCRKGISF